MDTAALAGASLALFLAYAAVMVLFHVYFAYGLQLVAERQEQGEAARVLAWIPGLQLYTWVVCGGGSLGTFLGLFVGGMGVLFVLGLLEAFTGSGGALLALVSGLWSLGLMVYFLALNWRLAERQGLSGAVSLLLLLPVLNLVAWWMIAYRDGLGPVRWLGAVLGTLFLLLSIAPAGILFGTMGGTMLAMAAGAGQAGSPEESAAMIAQIQRAMESGKTAGGPGASGRSPEVPDPWQAFGSEYTPDTGRCPPGTVKHGAQPPRGFEQWCARKGSEGEKRHGWTMTWHPNGVRATQGNYRDGLRTGTWIRWDDGGMKRAEALFEGGEQNGLMRRFDVYGESLQEVYFRDGQPVDMPGS